MALVLPAVGVPALAQADDDEDAEGATLVRKTQLAPTFRPWAGLEARLGREMTWARWMMANDESRALQDETNPAPWLDLAVFRDGPAYARPDAETSAISALGSLVTAGLPMLQVRRDGRIRQRHSLRGYFRGRGLSLAWRIEF
jgi:hypothetical protein